MSDFGLAEREQELIRTTLKRHPGVVEARVYGSRAMGRHRPNSDIDVVIWGDIDEAELTRIHSELEELPLPYLFDVSQFENIRHRPLRAHIERVGQPIYRR
jgi:predicted nucleotidyltransferase